MTPITTQIQDSDSESCWRLGEMYEPISNYVEGFADQLFSARWPSTEQSLKQFATISAGLETDEDLYLESKWAHYSHLSRLYCHCVVPSLEHLVLKLLDSYHDGQENPVYYFSCPIGPT
jgi:hypothetical protein